MIQVRRANDRGHVDHGWLKAHHTFSFGSYHDPQHREFRALRVMNEDLIAAGQGFGTHPHKDMEIVTYVLEGALEHKDSMGNGATLRAGEFQRISAGTGITHSEFNPSDFETTHLYQIWLFPERRGIEPSYEQKRFSDEDRHNQLRLVASPNAADRSLTIHQDTHIYLASLTPSHRVLHDLRPGRHAWLQILRGTVTANGIELQASDGAALSDEHSLWIEASQHAEVMLFDLA